jgi:hypothetical protein
MDKKRVNGNYYVIGALLLLSIVLCGAGICFADPVSFVPPTPADGTVTTNTSALINVSLTELNLTEYMFDWNGTNNMPYDDSLILLMNFDNVSAIGETGTNVVDTSLYGNNGECIGMGETCAYTTGKYGSALQFNGAEDYVSVGALDSDSLTLNGHDFTISAWYNPQSLNTTGYDVGHNLVTWSNAVLGKGNPGSGYNVNGDKYGYGWRISADSKLYFVSGKYAYPSTYMVAATDNDVISLNEWNYITIVKSGSTLQMYVNGINEPFTYAPGYSTNPDHNDYDSPYCGLTVGRYYYDQVNCDRNPSMPSTYGSIDEVRIYNRSLSGPEVKQQYASNLNKYDADKWQFIVEQVWPEPFGSLNYVYGACAKDIAGNADCTGTRTLTAKGIIPEIYYTEPTPADGTVTTDTSALINVSITEQDLAEVKLNWNGTDYSIYNDSLILMMNFDNVAVIGDSTTKSVDVSGSGNNGTISGATHSTGIYGQALGFDGVDDYVNVGDSNDWKFGTGDFSVGFWMKANVWHHGNGEYTEPFEYMSVMGNGKFYAANDNFDGFQFTRIGQVWSGLLGVPEGGIMMYFGDGTNYDAVGTLSALSPDTWYYVIGTRKDGVAAIYLNGMPQQSKTVNIDVSVNNALTLGKQNDLTYPRYFNGSIDELRVWSGGLNADEIKQIYNSNLNKYEADKWQFVSNQSDLSPGTYTYQAFAMDGSNNQNQTEQRTLTIIGCTDADGDTFSVEGGACGPADCNDSDANVNPGKTEVCGNSIDDDCDGLIDEGCAPACVNASSGLISWWPGEGNADDIVDSNPGTVHGATYTTGKVGQAFSFDGVDDYVVNPGYSTMPFPKSFSFWFYAKDSTNYRPMIREAGGALIRTQDGANRLEVWSLVGLSESPAYYATPTQIFNLNEWNQVVVTLDSLTSGTIYLNGVAETLSFSSVSTRAPYDSGIQIGKGDQRYFNGYIDEVSIYNRALTTSEVQSIYGAGSEGICKPASCITPPAGLVSWWPGEGNANDIWDGNPGTLLNGATFTAGKVGQAFSFDGVDDQVQIPDATNLAPAQLTVGFWMRSNVDLNSNTPASVYLIPVGKLNSGIDVYRNVEGYDFNYYPKSGFFAFGISRSDGFRAYASKGEITFSAGAWHHIAGTYDQSNIKLYIDGVLAGTTPASFQIDYHSAPLLIGGGVKHLLFSSVDQYFNGSIDEVEIYNRALSAEEIAGIYNAGSAGNCKPVCTDADGDGFYAEGGSCGPADCDDNDNTTYPGAPELCDGINNDCDGQVNEGLSMTGLDGRTFTGVGQSCGAGVCAGGTTRCGLDKAGLICGTEDMAGAETCNGMDDNCDGQTDEGGVCPSIFYYCDQDGDTYISSDTTGTCNSYNCAPFGCTATPGDDCDDANFTTHAGAAEVCNGIDDDCSALTADGSGESWYNQGTSCGLGKCDGNTGVLTCQAGAQVDTCNPYAGAVSESCNDATGYDGSDNNCDGTTDLDCNSYCDQDGDNYTSHEICVSAGELPGDCDDTSADINPGKEDIACDGIDQDCSTADFQGTDIDGDGYKIEGGLCGAIDCNDANASIYPGKTESQQCLGASETCPGTQERTCQDAGTYTSWTACDYTESNGQTCSDTDECTADDVCSEGSCTGSQVTCGSAGSCDGTNKIWTGTCDAVLGCTIQDAPAETCNGIDDDCDIAIDEDFLFLGSACTNGIGACARNGAMVCASDGLATDCNAHPGIPGTELCDAGLTDEDCDGSVNENCQCIEGQTKTCGNSNIGECKQGTQTCDINGNWGQCTGAVYATTEICDGKDNDCNGQTDESLADITTDIYGYGNIGECRVQIEKCTEGSYQISQQAIAPATEICDGKDNDCNGQTDDVDIDLDGFNDCNGQDKCTGLILPPRPVAFVKLNPNSYALESQIGYGCTSEEILAFCKPGDSLGQYKHGISQGTYKNWLNQRGWALACQVNGKVK